MGVVSLYVRDRHGGELIFPTDITMRGWNNQGGHAVQQLNI